MAVAPLQREQPAACGVAENRLIKVQQKRLMAVTLADEVELALEHAVARYIRVEKAVCEIPG